MDGLYWAWSRDKEDHLMDGEDIVGIVWWSPFHSCWYWHVGLRSQQAESREEAKAMCIVNYRMGG